MVKKTRTTKVLKLRKEFESYFGLSCIKTEKVFDGKKWWYVQTLVNHTKDENSPIFDLQLSSVDLGVMPWNCSTVMHMIQHMIDVENVTFKYPVIVSPSGWVLNGWHRVFKAIMQGKISIKAIKIFNMPSPDGTDTD